MSRDSLPARRDALTGALRWRRAAMLAATAMLLAACGDDGRARDGALLARTSDEALADAMVTSGSSARRVADYELTEDNIERWFEADAALASAAEDDPAVASRLAAESVRRSDRDPIRRAVAHLASIPEARDALEEAGITPDDFVLTGLALHQALLAADPHSPGTLRRLAARNAAFVERHADVLARYVERRPRYMATAEPAPADDVSDSLTWLDTATATGGLPPDSAYPVDTAVAMPVAVPMSVDTVAPAVPATALPPVVPVPLPAPARPARPETIPPPPGHVPSPAPTPALPPPR